MEVLKIKKFHAVIPSRANPGDAGLDISSVEDVIIPAKSWKLVDTGLDTPGLLNYETLS